jgi:hypothetical protein
MPTDHPIAVAAAVKPPNLPIPRITGQVHRDRFITFQVEWTTYNAAANLRLDTVVTFLATTMEDNLKRGSLGCPRLCNKDRESGHGNSRETRDKDSVSSGND